LHGVLMGHFEDVGHAPDPSTFAVPGGKRFHIRKWCTLNPNK